MKKSFDTEEMNRLDAERDDVFNAIMELTGDRYSVGTLVEEYARLSVEADQQEQ